METMLKMMINNNNKHREVNKTNHSYKNKIDQEVIDLGRH